MTDRGKDEALHERCEQVAGLAAEALDWLGRPQNRARVGSESASLARTLRRGSARARKLAVAARRNMCVGVFGPSQAGKSFLVSVLARPSGGRLVADFGGEGGRRDFISEINPEGEGESTGLVTRFTMGRPPAAPGAPVRLRLLTEADLARVLGNTFLMDGDQSETPPTPDEIAALVEAHRGRGGAGRGLSEEDVWETRDYFEKSFGKSAYVAALRPFWEAAAEIAPRLGAADRARFLAPLWGRHAAFTELYLQLSEALDALGHAAEVNVGVEALVPREASIVDVKTLEGLDAPEAAGRLAVVAPSGARLELPRPVVTALTAELIVPMAEQPWDIFATTDLLDFPGARARFSNNIERIFADAKTPRKDTFLRGKVAYLFDRYVAEQELTSMLLCVAPSNMEVTDLPGLVKEWVVATHGASAAERARSECILFFVLTKFDMHLTDSAGASDDAATRFQRRMQASLLEPFGKLADDWPNDWDGRPFRNCFWLRNPNYPAEAVIRYEGGREVEVLEHKRGRLAELKAGCLAAPAVATHFAAPEAAWDAAMALDDGGVSYLVAALAPVCRPEIKARQVRGQLATLAGGLAQLLRPFHVSDDYEARLEEKRAAADRLVEATEHVLGQNRFGELLEALVVDPNRIADKIIRVPDSLRIVAGAAAAAAGAPSPPRRAVLPGRARPAVSVQAAAPPAGGPSLRTLTREAFQAECAMQAWIETMYDFVEGPEVGSLFGMAPATARDLASELAGAARRVGLQRRIETELADWNFALSNEEQSGPVSVVAAERINRFVTRLGADELPEAARPQVGFDDGASAPVFLARAIRFDLADLPAAPEREAERYWTDWITTLYALFEANAKDGLGGDFDQEENARLGRILGGVAAAS
jgi:hypothetical protein